MLSLCVRIFVVTSNEGHFQLAKHHGDDFERQYFCLKIYYFLIFYINILKLSKKSI
jgi:hypothetical protein